MSSANRESMLVRPWWVHHTGHPINSIDVDPTGSRFVTGGGDKLVKIWDVDPLFHFNPASQNARDGPAPSASKSSGAPASAGDTDEPVPERSLLCCMDNHNGAVNCVRFCPAGSMIASASDDRSVILWKMRGPPAARSANANANGALPSSSFASSERNGERESGRNPFRDRGHPEDWYCHGVLLHHSNNVEDVAWAPDSLRLASCSVDNNVVIWDVARIERLAVLSDHNGWVKGLSWDPLDKFLTTQTADGVMRVWRTSDWKLEKEVCAVPYCLF